MHRIEQDWFTHVKAIESKEKTKANHARKELCQKLTSIAQLFAEMPYFLSEDFSLVDCYIAPLLWRFPSYEIELSKKADPIIYLGEHPQFEKLLFARLADFIEYNVSTINP